MKHKDSLQSLVEETSGAHLDACPRHREAGADVMEAETLKPQEKEAGVRGAVSLSWTVALSLPM